MSSNSSHKNSKHSNIQLNHENLKSLDINNNNISPVKKIIITRDIICQIPMLQQKKSTIIDFQFTTQPCQNIKKNRYLCY